MRFLIIISIVTSILASARYSLADAPTPRKVVLAPLATLGSEAKKQTTDKVWPLLARGIESVPRVELVSRRKLERALRKAKKPQLRTCDGNVKCLAKRLGVLIGHTRSHNRGLFY